MCVSVYIATGGGGEYYVSPFACLSIYLSLYLSVYLSICVQIDLCSAGTAVGKCFFLFVCLLEEEFSVSISLSTYLRKRRMLACVYVCVCACGSLYQSMCNKEGKRLLCLSNSLCVHRMDEE